MTPCGSYLFLSDSLLSANVPKGRHAALPPSWRLGSIPQCSRDALRGVLPCPGRPEQRNTDAHVPSRTQNHSTLAELPVRGDNSGAVTGAMLVGMVFVTREKWI